MQKRENTVAVRVTDETQERLDELKENRMLNNAEALRLLIQQGFDSLETDEKEEPTPTPSSASASVVRSIADSSTLVGLVFVAISAPLWATGLVGASVASGVSGLVMLFLSVLFTLAAEGRVGFRSGESVDAGESSA